MNTTEHYQLNQWEGSDRIMREDFNADNRKTEEALTELAETVAQKLGQAEVDATLRWVKIGSASLSGDSQTLAVSIPNAEQYRFFLLVMDLTSNFTVHLKWQNTACDYMFSTGGAGIIDHAAGLFLAAALPLGGIFAWYAMHSLGSGGNRSESYYKLLTDGATSGNITVQLQTDSGKVLHAGSSLSVYGLRK